MRKGAFTVRGENLVITRIRIWANEDRAQDPDDGHVVRIGVQRASGELWAAEWNQRLDTLPGREMHTLSGVEPLNYPLQDGDVIIGDCEAYGSPTLSMEGISIEVQASRVGGVNMAVVEERPGFPGAREIDRPLFRGSELAADLNKSGVPDMTIPIYF